MSYSDLTLAVAVAYCGWDPTVLVTDETVLLDGNGAHVVALPSLNVTAVSAVVVTDRFGTAVTCTVDDLADSVGGQDVGWGPEGLLSYNGCRFFRGYWPVGQQNIAVTYSGGYDGAPVDLAAALANLDKRLPTLTGVTSAKIGTGALSFAPTIAAGGLLLVEQMVLDKYRLPKVR